MSIEIPSFKEITWSFHLEKCPHCNEKIELTSASFISPKIAMGYLFNNIGKHLEICKPKSKKICKVELTRKTTPDDISQSIHKMII